MKKKFKKKYVRFLIYIREAMTVVRILSLHLFELSTENPGHFVSSEFDNEALTTLIVWSAPTHSITLSVESFIRSLLKISEIGDSIERWNLAFGSSHDFGRLFDFMQKCFVSIS